MSDPLDVARNIFMNGEGELRSGWRVLAFGFFFIVSGILLTGLTKALVVLLPSFAFLLVAPSGAETLTPHELIYLFVSNFTNLAAAVIATAVCAHLLEHRSFASVGFKLHRRWLRDFVLGLLMGGASLVIAVGIAHAAGAVTFDVNSKDAAFLARGLAIVAGFFLITGVMEELVFRGFGFQAVVHNLGGPAAIAITSVIFGLAHLSNPSSTFFSTINTILAGVWLGLAYLMTRSLWLAAALHVSWNFVMAFIFGLPVSGFTNLGQLAWLRGHIGYPEWISGGDYGPEAGIAATAALILSTLAIWKSGLFTASQEMLVAIEHGKPRPTFVSVIPDHEKSDALDSQDSRSQ